MLWAPAVDRDKGTECPGYLVKLPIPNPWTHWGERPCLQLPEEGIIKDPLLQRDSQRMCGILLGQTGKAPLEAVVAQGGAQR